MARKTLKFALLCIFTWFKNFIACGNQFYVLVVGLYLNYSMHNHFLLVKAKKKLTLDIFGSNVHPSHINVPYATVENLELLYTQRWYRHKIFYQYVSLVCLFHIIIFFVKGDQGMEIQCCVRNAQNLGIQNSSDGSVTLSLCIQENQRMYYCLRKGILVLF